MTTTRATDTLGSPSPVKMFVGQLVVAVVVMGVGGAVIASNLPSGSGYLADDGNESGVLCGIALVALGQIYGLVYTIALGVYFGVKGAQQREQLLRDPVTLLLQGLGDVLTAVLESAARGIAAMFRALGRIWASWNGLTKVRKITLMSGLVCIVALGCGTALLYAAREKEMATERSARFGCSQLEKQIPTRPSNQQFHDYLVSLQAPVRQQMEKLCPRNYHVLERHAASVSN